MSLVLQSSGGGQITIQEPNTASNFTQDLPAVTGNVVIDSATQTLTNKSIAATQLTGTIAAARLPAGSVLQVVNATYAVETQNNTSTFADTGLSASITPTSSSSKILILISHGSNFKNASNASNSLGMQLVRGSTNIASFGRSLLYTGSAIANYGSISYCYLDSPATTSSTTYKTQFKNEDSNTSGVAVQVGSSTSTITLLEIAA
jgi:hypothetical protein